MTFVGPSYSWLETLAQQPRPAPSPDGSGGTLTSSSEFAEIFQQRATESTSVSGGAAIAALQDAASKVDIGRPQPALRTGSEVRSGNIVCSNLLRLSTGDASGSPRGTRPVIAPASPSAGSIADDRTIGRSMFEHSIAHEGSSVSSSNTTFTSRNAVPSAPLAEVASADVSSPEATSQGQIGPLAAPVQGKRFGFPSSATVTEPPFAGYNAVRGSQITTDDQASVNRTPNSLRAVSSSSSDVPHARRLIAPLSVIKGGAFAERFIKASIFGHATELAGSSAPSTFLYMTVQAAGLPTSSAVSAPDLTSIPAMTSEDHPSPASSLAQGAQPGPLLSAAVLSILTPAEPPEGSAVASDFANPQANAQIAERQPIVFALFPARSIITSARTMTAAMTAPAQVDRASDELDTSTQERTSTLRATSTSDARDAQASELSSVHVTAAFACDESSIRIFARVSGADAGADAQIEKKMLAATGPYKGAVERLRLNGIDRITSVRR